MPDTPIPPPFDAYAGNEPYTFVSYSHRDAATVFPELVLLRDMGYRIWYDEGIDPGNEWPEAVAEALASCACFIVYVSPNAVNSRNVRDEIHFAIRHNKPLVPIHIAETELPGGLELRIGTAQAILKYRTSAANYLKLVQRALPSSVKATPVSPVVVPELQPAGAEGGPKSESPRPLHNVGVRSQVATAHSVSQWRTLPILTRRMLMIVVVSVTLVIGWWGIENMMHHGANTASTSALSAKAPNITAGGHPMLTGSPQTKRNEKDGAEMIWIPPGQFLMGDDDQKDNPRRTVDLIGYWIYKNVVTVGEYKRYVAAMQTAHMYAKMPDAPFFEQAWIEDDHPIVNVSWQDAKAYCIWAGVSLPTEAQWEKAARGTDGRKYPWGNDWDAGKCANPVVQLLSGTVGVGCYTDSPYGLSDMAGNVWQWCFDWYDKNYSKKAPSNDPWGPDSGTMHVLRGGSWFGVGVDAHYFRASHRYQSNSDVKSPDVGFRCVSGE